MASTDWICTMQSPIYSTPLQDLHWVMKSSLFKSTKAKDILWMKSSSWSTSLTKRHFIYKTIVMFQLFHHQTLEFLLQFILQFRSFCMSVSCWILRHIDMLCIVQCHLEWQHSFLLIDFLQNIDVGAGWTVIYGDTSFLLEVTSSMSRKLVLLRASFREDWLNAFEPQRFEEQNKQNNSSCSFQNIKGIWQQICLLLLMFLLVVTECNLCLPFCLLCLNIGSNEEQMQTIWPLPAKKLGSWSKSPSCTLKMNLFISFTMTQYLFSLVRM